MHTVNSMTKTVKIGNLRLKARTDTVNSLTKAVKIGNLCLKGRMHTVNSLSKNVLSEICRSRDACKDVKQRHRVPCKTSSKAPERKYVVNLLTKTEKIGNLRLKGRTDTVNSLTKTIKIGNLQVKGHMHTVNSLTGTVKIRNVQVKGHMHTLNLITKTAKTLICRSRGAQTRSTR